MPARTTTLSEYLFARLRQLGIDAIHGVPGDYNLTLLDYVEPSGLTWVGNANELNAGYAADGYARVKGFGALITTFGVGELSAINAIAGAFTERASVVHIVGTPPRDSQDSRLMVHHTLGDGDYRHFGQMHAHVTVAQTNLLDARTVPEQIDTVLQQCLIHSRPVYIEIPADMVGVEVIAERLDVPITVPSNSPNPQLEETINTIFEKITSAKSPVILVDGETRALRASEVVQSLITLTGWTTFTTNFGAGLIDMTAPNVYGIYQGSYADEKARKAVEGSDLVLFFGPHLSSTNTYAFSSIPKEENTISFTQAGVIISGKLKRHNSAVETIKLLLSKLEKDDIKTSLQPAPQPDLSRVETMSFKKVLPDEKIKQDKVWHLLANFLRPGDVLMGETGTAGYGVRKMPLPKHVKLFSPITWLSIGYMLPACQGAALAQQELVSSGKYHGISKARTVLVIGDGSFQMTAQELATIIRLKLNVVIFLINNNGYTIERCIHGVNQKYNDVSPWRYLQAPTLFGAPDTFTGSARTYGELQKLAESAELADGDGLRMVEVFMEQNDAPIGPLLDMMNKELEADAKRAAPNGVKGKN